MTTPLVRRGSARSPRLVVQVAVADPDLAEDCLAAVAACGLPARRAELASLVGGCAVLLVDDAAARDAGDAVAAAAWTSAAHAIAVCSDLAPARPLARDAVSLPGGTGELLGLLERAAGADSGGRLLVVAGAHGGAGTSTFACVAAQLAAQDAGQTLLVEADPAGPGLDLLLGMENEPGIRLGAVHAVAGELDGDELWEALPKTGELAVACRGEEAAGALAVARAGVRSGRFVVSDAGRAATADAAWFAAADAVVLCTRATVASLAQTAQAVAAGASAVAAVVVRRCPGDTLGDGDIADWWDEVSGTTGCAAAVHDYPTQRRIAAALESGDRMRPGRALAGAARAVVEVARG